MIPRSAPSAALPAQWEHLTPMHFPAFRSARRRVTFAKSIMAHAHDSISPELQSFIEAQHLFFVASAPTGSDGHVNLSPKGMDTFRILSPTRVCYLDFTGSGNETAAHLLQNGRITFMFCSFEGKPSILRLYGKGRAIPPESPEFAPLASLFADAPGIRQIILADLTRTQTSCGFGVPMMNFQSERDTLTKWAEKKGPDGLRQYRDLKNRVSIDNLPTA
jgi:hypothetical protein